MSNKQQKPRTERLITIGLDIGYGVVKAVTDSTVVTFPSVCGHAREIKFRAEELSAQYPGCGGQLDYLEAKPSQAAHR